MKICPISNDRCIPFDVESAVISLGITLTIGCIALACLTYFKLRRNPERINNPISYGTITSQEGHAQQAAQRVFPETFHEIKF